MMKPSNHFVLLEPFLEIDHTSYEVRIAALSASYEVRAAVRSAAQEVRHRETAGAAKEISFQKKTVPCTKGKRV